MDRDNYIMVYIVFWRKEHYNKNYNVSLQEKEKSAQYITAINTHFKYIPEMNGKSVSRTSRKI